MYIYYLNSILMRPPHFYERGYAYAFWYVLPSSLSTVGHTDDIWRSLVRHRRHTLPSSLPTASSVTSSPWFLKT